MKIICDNQEEYDELMRISEYLHDFDNNGYGLNIHHSELGSFLCHLHLDGNDFPTKADYVTIANNQQ